MKRLLYVIVICSMLFGFAGCTNKNEFDVGNVSDISITNKNVELSIKPDTLTNTGATFILMNNSESDIEYGNPYEIEIKQDNEWHKINVQLDFTMQAFILKSGESREIDLNWENGYGKLVPSEYRLIKSINIPLEDGTFDSFYVAVVFNIEK